MEHYIWTHNSPYSSIHALLKITREINNETCKRIEKIEYNGKMYGETRAQGAYENPETNKQSVLAFLPVNFEKKKKLEYILLQLRCQELLINSKLIELCWF